MWTPTKIAVLLTFFVVGLWTGSAYGQTEITMPANAKVEFVSDNTCRQPSYRQSINTLYVYSCNQNQGMTGRIFERSTKRLGQQVEQSIQHGVDRQISDLGKKLDKILGRY